MNGRDPGAPFLLLEAPAIIKGGAKVSVVAAPHAPASEECTRPVSADEAAEAGLFRPRLIEFGETREETIVSARPFVREELVVGRAHGRRVERIEETVRRTEVEVEDLPPRARLDDRLANEDPEGAPAASASFESADRLQAACTSVERGTQ